MEDIFSGKSQFKVTITKPLVEVTDEPKINNKGETIHETSTSFIKHKSKEKARKENKEYLLKFISGLLERQATEAELKEYYKLLDTKKVTNVWQFIDIINDREGKAIS